MSQNRAGEAWYELDAHDTKLKNALQKAESDVKASGARAEAGFSAAMSKMGGNLTSLGGGLERVGRSMLTNLTLPILAAGGAAAHFAVDFDSALRQVVALTDITQEEIGGVREELLKLAPVVGKSPQELAEAFYFVASAGFSAAESMDVLKIAAKGSAIGMGTTQVVTQVLASTLNAYGHANLSAAKAGDILTAAVSDGAAEAGDFAGVIGNIVPLSAALGVSFDQVSAALAAMTLSGTNADEASTSLVQIFSSLLKATPQAEEAMRGLGLSSAGLRAELREKGLLATLKTLDERFGSNAQASSLVFGNIRALRGITNLLGLDEAQLNKVFADTKAALGNLDDGYKATAGAQRSIDQSMADLQVTAIQLGTDVLPLVVDTLAEVAAHARELAKWWSSLDEDTRKQIVQWLAWVAVAGPAALIVGKLVSALGALFSAVGFLTGSRGIPRLIGAMKTFGLVNTVALGAVLGLTYGLEQAAGPISDFFDALIEGKAANKTLHELNALMGDMQKSLFLRQMGVDAKEFSQAVEAAGGDAQKAFDAIKDASGDVGLAIAVLSGQMGDVSETGGAMFGRLRDQVHRAAADAAAAAKEIPEDLAATLEDGAFVVGPAADTGIVDPVDEALQKAVEDAAKSGDAIIDALATSLAKGPADLADELEALRLALQSPYPDMARRADLESALASQVVIDNLTSDDGRVRAAAAKQVKGWLKEYDLIAPGALAAGQLVNPSLQAGIDSNLDALLTYIRTVPATNITDLLDLADVLEEQGNEALAGYVRGLERARVDKLLTIQGQLLHDSKAGFITAADAYADGYAAAIAYANGLKAGGQVAVGYVRDFTSTAERLMRFAGSPDYTHSREAGEGVARTYLEELIGGLRGGTHGVAASIAALQAALSRGAGGSVALGPLSPPPAPPAMAQQLAGLLGAPTSGDTIYQLVINGQTTTFHSPYDAIDELQRLSAFGDGRLS